jgi:hypothetical protein
MSLTFDEIDSYLTKIFTGTDIVEVDGKLILFKHPSSSVKLRAYRIYNQAFNEAVRGGMLPAEQLDELIMARNIITKAEIEKLKRLEGQLEAQEILLSKTTRVKARQDRIKQAIRRLNHDITEIKFKKQSKMLMSAETKAEEDKTFYICSQCAYYEDTGNLLWASYQRALHSTNIAFKDKLLIAFVKFYNGIPTEIIRELSRSSLWRIRYVNSMKTSDPLFGVPASEYTTDQLNLVYWSNYYQNIFEMMPEDRPPDTVIDDDTSLDAYMKAYYEERNREAAERRSRANNPGKLQAFDSEEVIVTRSHELYEDIEYDTPREARKIKDRVDIKKKGKKGRR